MYKADFSICVFVLILQGSVLLTESLRPSGQWRWITYRNVEVKTKPSKTGGDNSVVGRERRPVLWDTHRRKQTDKRHWLEDHKNIVLGRRLGPSLKNSRELSGDLNDTTTVRRSNRRSCTEWWCMSDKATETAPVVTSSAPETPPTTSGQTGTTKAPATTSTLSSTVTTTTTNLIQTSGSNTNDTVRTSLAVWTVNNTSITNVVTTTVNNTSITNVVTTTGNNAANSNISVICWIILIIIFKNFF